MKYVADPSSAAPERVKQMCHNQTDDQSSRSLEQARDLQLVGLDVLGRSLDGGAVGRGEFRDDLQQKLSLFSESEWNGQLAVAERSTIC